MIIEIAGPVFKCAEDENIFFERLYSLPGYEKVLGKGRNLHLSVKTSNDSALIEEVQEVCNIWNTTYRVISE